MALSLNKPKLDNLATDTWKNRRGMNKNSLAVFEDGKMYWQEARRRFIEQHGS